VYLLQKAICFQKKLLLFLKDSNLTLIMWVRSSYNLLLQMADTFCMLCTVS